MCSFFNGKNFCLRGGVEHRQLKLSQFKREVVKIEGQHKVRYTYTEYGSKNRVGGLKQLKLQNKVVHQYESDDLHRCHVLLMDKYISKLPEELRGRTCSMSDPNLPNQRITLHLGTLAVPIGRHTLSAMMKRMSVDAQLEKEYTNHSLRAYGVTKLFKANLPEKLIMERSGAQVFRRFASVWKDLHGTGAPSVQRSCQQTARIQDLEANTTTTFDSSSEARRVSASKFQWVFVHQLYLSAVCTCTKSTYITRVDRRFQRCRPKRTLKLLKLVLVAYSLAAYSLVTNNRTEVLC